MVNATTKGQDRPTLRDQAAKPLFSNPYKQRSRQRYAVLQSTERGIISNDWPTVDEKGMQSAALVGGSMLSQMMSVGQREELTRPYLESLVAYIAMKRKAEALSSTPLQIFESADKNAREITSGPLYELFQRPNGLTTQMELWECMSIYTDLAGGALWVLTDRSGREIELGKIPQELWPIRFDLVTPNLDGNGFPASWSYNSARKVLKYKEHSTARLTCLNPHDSLGALGPTTPAYRALQRLYTLDTYTQGLLEDGGDPGGILTSERSTTQEQREELRESVDEKHRKAGEGRKTMMLPNGIKFQSFAFTPKDMEFLEMHQVDVDQTLAAYGVTRAFVGMPRKEGSLGDSGAATKAEQEWVWKNTLLPTQARWADQIQSRVFGRFASKERGYRVRFDTSGVEALRADLGQQIEQMERLMKLGRSWNEAAEIVGLQTAQPVEGGDVRYFSTSLRTQEEVDAAISKGSQTGGGAKAVLDLVEGWAKEDDAEAHAVDTAQAAWSPGEGDKDFEGTGLSGQARFDYAAKAFSQVQKAEKDIERKAARVIERYLLAQEKRLDDIAGSGKRADEFNDSLLAEPSLRKLVSDSEVEELLLQNQAEWDALMFSEVDEHVGQVWVGGASSIASELGVGVSFNKTHPLVLEWIANREPLLKETMQSLRQAVRNSLVAGLENGPSVGSLRTRVRETLDELKGSLQVMRNSRGSRALRIARTEGAAAMNTGRVEQMREAEVEAHEWMTSRDEQVRPRHSQVDGEVRTLDQLFSNGMRYPGDPNAPIEMTANERCTTAPVRRRTQAA